MQMPIRRFKLHYLFLRIILDIFEILITGGLLKMDSGRVLSLDEHNPNCRLVNGCVRSGDERVNHNAGLAAVHTVFAREHNRVARNLADVNPHWDEETIYQVSQNKF